MTELPVRGTTITAEDKVKKLNELAKELGVVEFDLMLVGDGAGSFADTECGWFVTSYEKKSGKVVEHYGGTNGGTNNYAELEPFNWALCAYRHVLWAEYVKAGADKKKDFKPPKVLIVSDSELTVKCGNREYARKSNGPLWASIEWFEQKGYKFYWRWVNRNSNFFNERADSVAKKMRALMKGFKNE